MAAEQELAVIKPFNMANELCIWLKIVNASDYKHIRKECSCVRILRWLGQGKFESLNGSETATGELISYLTICLLRNLLRFISASIYTKYNRFPYNTETVNQWFTLNEDVQRDQPVNIINVDEVGQESKCYTTERLAANGFSHSLEDEEFELFFHGTNHDSAQDIMKSGINLIKGSKRRDFSHGDGFYVGKSFVKAFDWSLRRSRRGRPNRSAVLVFRVAKIELRGNNNENGLDLRDLRDPVTKTEWERVVKEFRSGAACLDFIIDVNERYQFIEGPMASLPSLEPKEDSYQLCVRKQNCVQLFKRCLHSAVFFDN